MLCSLTSDLHIFLRLLTFGDREAHFSEHFASPLNKLKLFHVWMPIVTLFCERSGAHDLANCWLEIWVNSCSQIGYKRTLFGVFPKALQTVLDICELLLTIRHVNNLKWRFFRCAFWSSAVAASTHLTLNHLTQVRISL